MTELVPYTSFTALAIPDLTAGEALAEGAYQGIHFTVTCDRDWFLNKLEQWFEDRDDVILVDSGVTGKGLGFFLLEWEGCQIDPLFIAILEHEDFVEDISIYTRKEVS